MGAMLGLPGLGLKAKASSFKFPTSFLLLHLPTPHPNHTQEDEKEKHRQKGLERAIGHLEAVDPACAQDSKCSKRSIGTIRMELPFFFSRRIYCLLITCTELDTLHTLFHFILTTKLCGRHRSQVSGPNSYSL